MVTLNIVSLSIVLFLCLYGTLTRFYKDNLFQWVGFIFITLGCTKEILELWHAIGGSRTTTTLAFGCALYAIGTAWKVYKRNRK